jgi:hypothetical protein
VWNYGNTGPCGQLNQAASPHVGDLKIAAGRISKTSLKTIV